MKFKLLTIFFVTISLIMLSIYSIGQNENYQKNYINFVGMQNGNIDNFTYENETIIKSISIYPKHTGYWLEVKNQKRFIGENININVIDIKSPIIDIETIGNVTIKIIFNNFSITKAISFNGFLIKELNGVAFVSGGYFNISNSMVVINSISHLFLKIFIKNNASIGQFSKFMQSNEFNGIIFLYKNNSISEFLNNSINLSGVEIKNSTIFLALEMNKINGFVILDLVGYDKPLNLTVNGIPFRNTTIGNVTNGKVNSYSIINVNGSYVYLIYISSTIGSTQYNFFLIDILFSAVIVLVVVVAGYITLKKMVRR